MEAVQAHIDACLAEEAGARDALAEAFEALKKYEHIDTNAKAAAVKEEAKRETAALDELGLRRRAGK
jgi:flagellar FliJ protein